MNRQVQQDRASALLVHHSKLSGRPLISDRTIVQLTAITTEGGLTARSELDTNACSNGIKLADTTIKALNPHGHEFYGNWNCTIKPRPNPKS